MTKNLVLELFADGVQINEVDFMQRRQVFDSGTEFGQLSGGNAVVPETAMSMSAWE